jgi:hypothetical protein
MQRHRLTPFLLVGLLTVAPAAAQTPAASQPSVDQVIDRITKAELDLIERAKELKPLVEAYIQEVGPPVDGVQMPIVDAYFLGRLEWRDAPVLTLLADVKRTEKAERAQTESERRGYLPDGFAAMAAPDWKSLDRNRYTFKYVRREFLGEVRTIVFDVKPKDNPNAGFSGRIWVEERDYNIVRYNGVNRNVKGPRFRKRVYLHVDGWRVHAGQGAWLPAYVHCEETGLEGQEKGGVVRSQVKLWGYNSTTTEDMQAFTSIQISAVSDTTDQSQLTSVASVRRWEQEAEQNVVERLEKAGLLAPAGDVEKVLDTVLNNLQATNDVALERPVRARVLLTSPLESFTIGHTLVLSRGLIDVLPDEASLAMALAHELSHVVLGHRLIDDTKFGFADRMMISDAALLETIAMRRDAAEEAEADAKVVEMLDRSPYKDKLSSAGLFLRIVAERGKLLPELIHPHVGDHVSGNSASEQRLSELLTRAPDLKPKDLTQMPALPIGARLVVDPWSGRLELLRTAAALPGSLREKSPLAITPLTPHLRYVGGSMPMQTRAPLPRAGATEPPASNSADATPPLQEIEVTPLPAQSVPPAPTSIPAQELNLSPQTSAEVPTIVAVPTLTAPPAEKPPVPSLKPVPSIELAPDPCEALGTDAACSQGPKK